MKLVPFVFMSQMIKRPLESECVLLICTSKLLLSNSPCKKEATTRQGMQKGANFCTTLLLFYHTSDWLNQQKLTKTSGSCIFIYL